MNTNESKILITGPPRSGTTLMLMFFYKGGFDIGYSQNEVAKYYRQKSNGFEYMTDILYGPSGKKIENIPKVIKEPFRLSNYNHITVIDWALLYNINIQNLIVCVRSNLEESIKSSNRLLERKKRLFPHNKTYQDQNISKDRLETVEKCSYLFLRQIVEHDLSPIFIEFPRFKQDFDYCYNKLSPVFDVSRENFREIWDSAIDKARESV